MKLTSFTDYSLRVLMYLALEPTRRTTIEEVALSFDISRQHLRKVVQLLGRQGWLANVRGRKGGVALAMAPRQIVIGDVVRLTEGNTRLAICFDVPAGTCKITPACRLRSVFQEAGEALYSVLDRYTLADLVLERALLAQMLQIVPIPVVRAGLRAPAAPS